MLAFIDLVAPDFKHELQDREKMLVANLPEVGKYPSDKRQQSRREDDLHDLFFMLALRHFGAPATSDTAKLVALGAKLADEYFTTDWYDKHDYDRELMAKNRENKELAWFNCARYGLLHSFLAKNETVVATIANWVEPWMLPEDPGMDPTLAPLYVSVLSDLRTDKSTSLKDVESSLSKSRNKGPKLLYAAWQAVRKKHQAAFDTSLQQAISNFDKLARPPLGPADPIDLDATIILAAARHLGLQKPKLTQLQQARVITPETLGLPASPST